MRARLYHFRVCAVTRNSPAYKMRAARGVPLGFAPELWSYGWLPWLEGNEGEDFTALEIGEIFKDHDMYLGLFAMRPMGTPNDATVPSSFRLDAREHLEREGVNAVGWLDSLRRAWSGPIICGVGSQPRDFTRAQFGHWTAPCWREHMRVSFDACAGEANGSPIHACLTGGHVRDRILIERAPKLDDTHWHGLPIFGMHRGAFDADRVHPRDWAPGSVIRVEHAEVNKDGSGERTPWEMTELAEALLRDYPQISVAMDMTRLNEGQILRLIEVAKQYG